MLGSGAPGVLSLCLGNFQSSLSASLPINNCECCRRSARQRPATMEPLEASLERTDIFGSALLILFSCYENTAPRRWKGKECWTGERRQRLNAVTMPPGASPQDGSRGGDLGPGDPAGHPAGHIWQPLS